MKEEVWFVPGVCDAILASKISSANTLELILVNRFYLGIIIFFLPSWYGQNDCFFFFFLPRDFIVDGAKLVWGGKEKSSYKLTSFIKLLLTVLKDPPTPFGKVGKIENCHKLKFYSINFLYSTSLHDVLFEKSCKRYHFVYGHYFTLLTSILFVFCLLYFQPRTLTSLFTAGFRKSDLPSLTSWVSRF